MKKIHFIGIGGVSMSALAKISEKAGNIISGSDLKSGGHSADNIKPDLDLVVYTASITEGSPGFVELQKARELGVKTVSRGEYLATLVNSAKQSIVISGMHGKTTVTTMIGLILKEAKLTPTVIPGTTVKEFNGNFLAGDQKLIVTEGCEYYDTFLHLRPKIAVITNIEEEHLDYFYNLTNIIKSFAKFIGSIDPDGLLVYLEGDENIEKALAFAERKPKNIVKYGPNGDIKYQNLDFDLAVPGNHNRLNALAAKAVADYLKIDDQIIKSTLSNYAGAGRRLEIKGEKNGVLVIDDYGHHPTEIQTTIKSLKEAYPEKRLIVAFWPHQFKRIESLFPKFASAFSGADEVLLLPIYFVPGRDEVRPINSKQLADAISKEGTTAKDFKDEDEMVDYLRKNLVKNDLLLTIGIPPINKIAERYLQ